MLFWSDTVKEESSELVAIGDLLVDSKPLVGLGLRVGQLLGGFARWKAEQAEFAQLAREASSSSTALIHSSDLTVRDWLKCRPSDENFELEVSIQHERGRGLERVSMRVKARSWS